MMSTMISDPETYADETTQKYVLSVIRKLDDSATLRRIVFECARAQINEGETRETVRRLEERGIVVADWKWIYRAYGHPSINWDTLEHKTINVSR